MFSDTPDLLSSNFPPHQNLTLKTPSLTVLAESCFHNLHATESGRRMYSPDFSKVVPSSYLNLPELDNLCLFSLAPLLGAVLYFPHFGVLFHHFIFLSFLSCHFIKKIIEIKSVFKYALCLYIDLVPLLVHHLGDCILLF